MFNQSYYVLERINTGSILYCDEQGLLIRRIPSHRNERRTRRIADLENQEHGREKKCKSQASTNYIVHRIESHNCEGQHLSRPSITQLTLTKQHSPRTVMQFDEDYSE